MRRHLPQLHLDLSSDQPPGELIKGVTEALVGGNGQRLPGAAEVTPHQRFGIPARAGELQQLLGASIDENRHLTAHVRRLKAELRRSSAELAKLRGDLRGAVHDALTDPLTGLANRRSFDLELEAVGARASRSSPAQLAMADIDHFKRVNDVHGHDTDEEVLRIIGGSSAPMSGATAWSPVWAGMSSAPAARGEPALCGRDRLPPVRASRVPPARRAAPTRDHRSDHALDRGGRLARGRKQCRMVCTRRCGAVRGEAPRPQPHQHRSHTRASVLISRPM
jgi:Diguanylate cyclase, GGDEF domain